MATIHEMRLKSNAFIANMDLQIEQIAKKLEPSIVSLNKKQMDKSIGFTGSPLINKKTGSGLLSPAYAKRTGKRKPDMNLSGSFRKGMISVYDKSRKTFEPTSTDSKIEFLPGLYDNLLGLVPSNLSDIQTKAGLMFQQSYENALK